MKLPKTLGGIGYPDVQLKLLAFKMMILVKFWKTNETLPWHHFAQRSINRNKLFDEIINSFRKHGISRVGLDRILIGNRMVMLEKVCVKDFYSFLISEKYGQFTNRAENYWIEFYPSFDWKPIWRVSLLKFSDGFSKNIHFYMLHNAHNTKRKLSHFSPHPPYCALCSSRGIDTDETTKHAFLDCFRAQELYNSLLPFWRNLGFSNVSEENKIFGFCSLNTDVDKIANLSILAAHRAIWQNRNFFDRNNVERDVFEFFKGIYLKMLQNLLLSVPIEEFRIKYGTSTGITVVNGFDIRVSWSSI